jgi:acyl-CoA synthetase (AMP-forming)/AMP-acid ligase II
MFDRYLDNPKATAESFYKDPSTSLNWFKTGDCAMRVSQHEGSYKILGRFSQDIIKKAGYKISALEIEFELV